MPTYLSEKHTARAAFWQRLSDPGAAVVVIARRVVEQWRLRRTIHILGQLDDRTLKDIGLDRSEISSAVATRGAGRISRTKADAIARY